MLPVESLVQSYIEADIHVVSYLLPFRDRHLRFLTNSHVEQSPQYSNHVARPRNIGIAVGISLLTCIEAEIYVLSFLLPVNGRHL